MKFYRLAKIMLMVIVGVFAVGIFLPNTTFAANACQSTGSGNWSVAGTWTNCGGVAPAAADTVEIMNGHVVTLNADKSITSVTIDSGGTLTEDGNSRTLTVTSGWTNNGTFTPVTSTVVFSNNTITVAGNATFNNLTFSSTNGANTFTVSNTLTATGTLTFAGTGRIVIDTGTINAKGNITVTNTANNGGGGTATININGGATDGPTSNGNQTFTGPAVAGQGPMPNITINKTGGTLYLAGIISINNNGTWLYTAGTVDATTNGSTLYCVNACAITGTHTLNNLTLDANANNTDTITNTLTLNGTLTLAGGANRLILNGGTINAKGNITVTNTSAAALNGGTMININGGATDGPTSNGDQTLTGTAAVAQGLLPKVTINKTAGILHLAGKISLGADFVYTAGTVDAGSSTLYTGYIVTLTTAGMSFNNLEIGGTTVTTTLGSALTIAGNLVIDSGNTLSTSNSNYNVTVGGNWTNNGTYTSGSNTTIFNGSSDSTIITGGTGTTQDFQNLTINKTNATTTLSTNGVDVDGILTITAGTLDLNGQNISTTATCNNSGTLRLLGTETISCTPTNNTSSTVQFYGAGDAVVSKGGSAFYNLTATTSGKTLIFPADTTTTINGTLTLEGVSGSNVVLKSSAAGTDGSKTGHRATLSVVTAGILDYLTIYDNAGTGTTLLPSHWTDGGNNTGWGPSPDITPPTPGTLAFSLVTTTSITASSTGAVDETALAALPYQYHNITRGTYSGATSTTWTETGLTAGTAYTYEVGVKDAAGNWATTTPTIKSTLATGTCGFITQYGITWTFDTAYTCGQFINGDWWVVGPVNVTSISPAPTGSGASLRNGSMVNPIPGNLSDGKDGQSYDGRNGEYNAAKLVTVPLNLSAGQSLISTESLLSTPYTDVTGNSLGVNQSYTKTAAILTALASAPTADAFRPAYAGTVKTLYYDSNLDWNILPSVAPSGTPPSTSLYKQIFQRPWVDHLTNWMGRGMHPADNMPNYGRDIAGAVGEAGLLLTLNNVSLEDKQQIARGLIQIGIDTKRVVELDPTIWRVIAGQNSGREFPVVFAARMFNDSTFKPPTAIFQEDDSTYYGSDVSPTQTLWTGWQNSGHKYASNVLYLFTYGVDNVGNPWYHENYSPPAWAGSPFPNNPSSPQYPFDKHEGYKRFTSYTYPGQAIAALLLGMKTLWNHSAFFAYADRWMNENDLPNRQAIAAAAVAGNWNALVGGSDWTNPTTYSPYGGTAWSSFESEMYTAYRSSFDDTTPPMPSTITFSNVTQTTITATTTATDDVALASAPFQFHATSTGYEYYSGATSTAITLTGLTANIAYSFEVGVVDTAGNWATSTIYATTTLANVPGTWTITASAGAYGTIDPTGPVSVTDGTDQTFTITPDSGYNIATLVIDSVSVATSTTYTFSNVTTDHTISATFEAVSVPPSDTTPPEISGGQPSGSQSAGTTQATLQVSTDESATCKYGTTANTTYADITNTFGTTGGTTHTQTLTGLSNGTNYTYYVRCTDGTNPNTSDYTVSFSVANPTVSHSSGGSINPYYLRPVTPTPVIPTLPAFTFTRDLKLGMTGTDIKNLQIFLNTHGYIVATASAGSLGQETIYFGPATQAALIRYQKANSITPAVGYFGPVTRASVYLASLSPTQPTATSTPTISSTTQISLPSHTFTTPLTLGMTHPDIRILQQFLNTDPDTRITQTGIGSPGHETLYFGFLTLDAVKRFQIKYNIAKQGESGFGNVGPKTRAKLNELQ